MYRSAVAAGGALGALARHGVGVVVTTFAGAAFPWGTLAVNVCGSWVLGVLMSLLPATSVRPAVRVGLTIGFCGGFTTFSTFAHETVALAQAGEHPSAVGYVGASLLLGVMGMAGGMATGAMLTRERRGAASSRLDPQAPPARETEDAQ
jgi:fluoride exporter